MCRRLLFWIVTARYFYYLTQSCVHIESMTQYEHNVITLIISLEKLDAIYELNQFLFLDLLIIIISQNKNLKFYTRFISELLPLMIKISAGRIILGLIVINKIF